MSTATPRPDRRQQGHRSAVAPGDDALAARLRREVRGEVLFDRFTRGRYATDASIYQIEPIGVVVPRDKDDVAAAFAIAREAGVPLLPRGGGTSQCGQTVGEALVLDTSKSMNQVLDFDAEARRATVQPGLVLDRLNAFLKPHGLWFPVDVSTGSRATIGGMTGNNSCGTRSLRYGNMVHNVRAIDALMIGGARARFGRLGGNLVDLANQLTYARLVGRLCSIATREADEIRARFPRVQRRVGGYNIDMLPVLNQAGGIAPTAALEGIGEGLPWAERAGDNMAHILVGSEGTLAFFEAVELELQPLPPAAALGICHFPTFRRAMEVTPEIVALGPSAVELVDRTLIGLAREIPLFRARIERYVAGAPDALLLVEFSGDDDAAQRRKLKDLVELMGTLGLPGSVVEVTDRGEQSGIWEVRKACLDIAMSMKGDGKPVSFVEDAAVRLEDLADYTERLEAIFHKYGTQGTWYAHASVGTLHVRPILNLKQEAGAKALRGIAEETFAMVREYKGSHSGEHGDGIVRSEFHEPMFGPRIVRAFEDVKDAFDPEGLLNPGKIVRPERMDDRALFRFKPGYAPQPLDTALDWSAWGGFAGAVEMCNNNGACRKFDAAVMCPSFRVTGDEQHVTRGRANTLRLAISGQLGEDALMSDAMRETMALCVGCKGCKRECPTGVDMARMKVEFLHQYTKRHGLRLRERAVAWLPRYAPVASRLAGLMNLRDRLPGLARLSERWFGLSAQRALPAWQSPFRAPAAPVGPAGGAPVALFVDTFTTYFEPENARAALRLLAAAGRRVTVLQAADGGRPLCCGRTFLAAGQVDQAREEMQRVLAAVAGLDADTPVLGLEPSCLFTFRDELAAVLPGAAADALAGRAKLITEYLAEADDLELPLKPLPQFKALLHGHCHEKAFAAADAAARALRLIPGLEVQPIASSCCGMAGNFGYQAETYEVSQRMAELSLLPAVRDADADTLIAADGTSCRHQIHDGTGRTALHVVRLLDAALDTPAG